MEEKIISINIEDTAGNQFEVDVPLQMKVAELAAEFFEAQGWDQSSRNQRAVVEQVNSKTRWGKKTKRLKAELTLEQAKIENNSTLRIFPESIAAGDPILRAQALAGDLNGMNKLIEKNDKVDFETNADIQPTEYTIYLEYESFVESPLPNQTPRIGKEHEIKIHLLAEYPDKAPIVIWKTDIFHPNIHPDTGNVCLGELMEDYVPGIGLSQIVDLLIDLVQWRNYNILSAYNREAVKWALNIKNKPIIEEIGGVPPLSVTPWLFLINPDNWEDGSNSESPFRKYRQPHEFKLQWEKYQNRKKITFRQTK